MVIFDCPMTGLQMCGVFNNHSLEILVFDGIGHVNERDSLWMVCTGAGREDFNGVFPAP